MNNMDIQYPWALFLLLLIPAVLKLRRKFRSTVGFSGVLFLTSRVEMPFFKRYAEEFLLAGVMAAIIFAIVNIRYSSYWHKSFMESKWIMIIQDLSGSMNRIGSQGDNITLGDIALQGAREFIAMRDRDDLIGIIAFSSFAQLIAPPTFDKSILEKKMELLSRRADSSIFRELTVGGATNASYAAWLGLCVFFMLLPEEQQPSIEEMDSFRYALLGKTQQKIEIPQKLKHVRFGQGMAIVIFSDGRIEANQSEEDIRKGLPNFANVVKLLKLLGVRVYLIAVDPDVNREVKDVFQEDGGEGSGRIFYLPTVDRESIAQVYQQIHRLEKNKLLVQISRRKKDTRHVLATTAMCLLLLFAIMKTTPWFRRV
jgi:hypothetical protein